MEGMPQSPINRIIVESTNPYAQREYREMSGTFVYEKDPSTGLINMVGILDLNGRFTKLTPDRTSEGTYLDNAWAYVMPAEEAAGTYFLPGLYSEGRTSYIFGAPRLNGLDRQTVLAVTEEGEVRVYSNVLLVIDQTGNYIGFMDRIHGESDDLHLFREESELGTPDYRIIFPSEG